MNDQIKNNNSFMSDLFSRRVPQFIGIYLGVSWGLIQFIDWIVGRYLLSPYIIDLCFGVIVSMIPSILILAYFHGKPGKDKWNNVEKIVIPTNFIVSIIALFIIFYPKDLSAVTKDIIITDANGNKITKTVVKSQFRKKYALFLFNNLSSNSDNNWMDKGIRLAIGYDLGQDFYLTNKTGSAVDIKKEMGFTFDEYLSLGDKQKIASRTITEYFVTGSHDFKDNNYIINVEIYKTSNAKLINNYEYKGQDFFSIIDEISKQIKFDMEIPATHIENTIDMPVKERFTDSTEALKYFTYYTNQRGFEDEYNNLKKAVEIDESFAHAQVMLYTLCRMSNNVEGYQEHMGAALKYINKLQEGMQFAVRIDAIQGSNPDPQKVNDILEMWIEFYPQDIRPYSIIVQYAMMENNLEKSILYANKILEIAPDMHEYILFLGDIYSNNLQKYEKGITQYNKYLDLYPQNPEGYEKIANVYVHKQDYDNAYKFMMKAQALGASGAEFELQLMNINYKLNNWTAETYVDHVYPLLTKYNNAGFQPTVNLYSNIYGKLSNRGKERQSLKYRNEMVEYVERTMGPGLGAFFAIDILSTKIKLGEIESAEKELDNLLSKLSLPPFNMMVPMMRACFYADINDWDKFNAIIDEAEEGINKIGFNFMSVFLDHMRGESFEFANDYDNAIKWYTKAVSTASMIGPTGAIESYISLGRIYADIGDYSKSEEMFAAVFAITDEHPELFYEYSIFKEKSGDVKDSKEFINKAYELYKNGDDELELKKKIIDKYAEFNQLP